MTGNAGYAILISLAAGLTMIIGAFMVFAAKRSNEKMLTAALGFAAGVMICVVFTDLLPEAEEHFGEVGKGALPHVLTMAFMLLGVALSAVLDRVAPEHDHHHGENCHHEGCDNHYADLFHIGIVSALALGLHNIPQGMAIYVTALGSRALGMSVAAAVAFHNIPAGIIIAMPVYYATGSKKKAIFYTLLPALAEPLGAVIGYFLMSDSAGGMQLGSVFGLVAGIMLYLTFEELIPKSREYGHSRLALWSILFGICVMMAAHIFQ